MNYRLNRQGVDLGVFSLEELRRRRQAGELTGTEYVLAEGAMEWRLLDVILQQGGTALAAFAAGQAPKSSRKWIWIAVAAGGCMLLIIGAAVMVAVFRFAKAVQKNQNPFQNAGQYQSQSADNPVAEASKPVAEGATPQTATDARKRAREFRVRQWVEGYEQRGKRDTPCDADAVLMLKAWLAEQYGNDDETNLPAVGPLVEKLAAQADCDDPLLLAMIGVETKDIHQRIQRLDRALSGFEKSRHRAYPKFYAAVMQADDWPNNAAKITELDITANRYFGEMFKDGALLPEDQVEMGEILNNGWGAKIFFRNQRTIYKAVPDKKPFKWLRLVLEGQYHVNEAWRHRGSGYANTVTEQGARGFADELAKAATCFSDAYGLQPGWPLAPSKMIEVALGESGIGEMRKWFDRTTAAQIDYPGAWYEIRWGLRPRWYGNEEAMLAFGATEVNTGRFDTDVPRMLFDSVSDLEAEENLPAGQHIYGRDDIWPLFQKMYEGYIAEPSQSPWRDGWHSTYATIAYIAGHYDVARAQLEAVHWNPWTNNFTGYGVDLTLMPLEVAARTGPASKEVDRAETARTDGNEKKAQQIYQDLSVTNSDARTGEFIRVRLASLGLQQKLGEGGWVDFLPTGEKDPNWAFLDTTVRAATNGVLEIESGQEGHFLYSHVPFTTGFEVKGDFEFVESTSHEFQAGVIMGLLERDGKNWLGFRIKRSAAEGDVACFTRGWTRTGTTKPVRLNNGTNSFSFRLENGVATATVNGAEVFRNAALPAKVNVPEGEFRVGLGAHSYQNVTLIRYRNVQVRRL